MALVVWSFLSAFWAVDTLKSLQAYSKVILLVSSGYLWWSFCSQLNLPEQRQLQKTVFVAALVLAGLLITFGLDAQFKLGFKLGFKKGLYNIIDQHISQALVHGCAACVLAIWMNNLRYYNQWIQISLVVLLAPILHLCSSDAASLAALLGLGVLIGYKIFPRLLKVMFIYGMPWVWLAFPFIFFNSTPKHYALLARMIDSSYTHRLFIWHSVAVQAFEKFWTGFGFGSSRYRSLGYEQDIILSDGTKDLVLSAPENCLHPHNFMMQFWFELGAVGVLLASLIWIMYWNAQYDRSTRYTIAFWGAALSIAATGISIWQTWWLILLVTLAPIYKLQDSANN